MCVTSVALVAIGADALAADMDPAPDRLVFATPAGPVPNRAAWANLVSELGTAVAPSAFHPARTTGWSGLVVTAQAEVTHVNADSIGGGVAYWHLGTRGGADPATGQPGRENTSPDSFLGVYSLQARKALPLGIELEGEIGWLGRTSLWPAGGGVRWAPLEGYRSTLLALLPDLSIGGGLRTLLGASSFSLTVVSMDAQISKPFTIARAVVVTPVLGASRVIVFADSSVVNVPPADAGGPGASVTFASTRVHRWRGQAGVSVRYELLLVAAQVTADLTDPADENGGIGVTGSKQWTASLAAGVSF